MSLHLTTLLLSIQMHEIPKHMYHFFLIGSMIHPRPRKYPEDYESRRASSRGLIPRAKVKTIKMTFVIVFGNTIVFTIHLPGIKIEKYFNQYNSIRSVYNLLEPVFHFRSTTGIRLHTWNADHDRHCFIHSKLSAAQFRSESSHLLLILDTFLFHVMVREYGQHVLKNKAKIHQITSSILTIIFTGNYHRLSGSCLGYPLVSRA